MQAINQNGQNGVRLSHMLRSALDTDQDGRVSVGEIVDRVEERGFGLLLILFALPTMIPVLPPGASAVVGVVYILLGLQMLVGRHYPWLPRRVREYALSPKVVKSLQERGVAFMERMERFTQPRWRALDHWAARSLVALVIIAIGIVLFLPLPFMNTLPALMLLMIGVGFLNRDGLLVVLGSVLCVAITLFVIFGAHLLVQLLQNMKGWVGM